MFGCKNYGRHRRVTIGAFVLALFLLSGCLPNPQQAQTRDLLDQLSQARGMVEQEATVGDGCRDVGDVETRLYGEPGLSDVQPAWSHLADAAHALQAVCGQMTLLEPVESTSPALAAAQARWQQGIQREMGVACDQLRAAADALHREASC